MDDETSGDAELRARRRLGSACNIENPKTITSKAGARESGVGSMKNVYETCLTWEIENVTARI